MKRIFVLVMVAAIFASCQKSEENTAPVTQEVVFSGIDVSGTNQKSTDVECSNPTADYAHVKINGEVYTPAVFYLDGKAYTQAIKFIPGTYTVSEFMLMNDAGTPGEDSDDIIVMATPVEGFEFASYVNDPLDLDFEVTAFAKAEVDIEVLCFEPAEYSSFGFNWFAMEEVVVREQVFFGDFCVKHPADYTGSMYDLNQTSGLQIDMPAIMELHVVSSNGFDSTFTNANEAHGYGVGHPLRVNYPDYLSMVDTYTFTLRILVKEGSEFNFVDFHTWSMKDGDMIEAGTDGVVEFVLGNCNFSDTDLQLMPYQNLPATVTMNIQNPGVLASYWDFTVTGNNTGMSGYDFGNPDNLDWLGWCADKHHSIGTGTHTFHVYSSMKPIDWPVSITNGISPAQVAALNWLFNNLDQFTATLGLTPATAIQVIEDLNAGTPGHHAAGTLLQDAVWKILNNYGTSAIATTALAQTEYTPLPGGYAAVFLVKDNDPTFQLLFVQVDP